MQLLRSIVARVTGGQEDRAPAAEEPAAEAAAPEDPFEQAVDHLRATAKWTLLTFAAVGAILVAGSQLSSIGRFGHGDWRLYVAVGAVAVALGGVGLAIWFVIAVETSGHVTLKDLVENEARSGSADKAFLDANRALLAGYDSAQTLGDTYQNYIDARFRAIREGDQATLERAQAWVAHEHRIIEQLLAAARYDRVRRTFQRWVWRIVATSVLTGLAVGTFAWAANEPEPSAGPARLRAPERAVVLPTGEETERLTQILGQACATLPIPVIVLSRTDDRADVVGDPPAELDDRCPPKRFTVDAKHLQPPPTKRDAASPTTVSHCGEPAPNHAAPPRLVGTSRAATGTFFRQCRLGSVW